MNKISVIMYHYIRNLKQSRYPEIKGLDSKLFEEQILYLKKHYNIISMNEAIEAVHYGTPVPDKSILLTFDDCYKDHYTYVFPILIKYGISGAFYAPMKCLKEKKVLDVNKIHFILASVPNKKQIISEIFDQLDHFRHEYNLEKNSFYYDKLAIPDRHDTADIIFIKRILQVELDEKLRNIVTSKLFNKFVGVSEKAFCEELYLTKEQISHMFDSGMHFGSHSYEHYWLNSLTKEKQEEQIDLSLKYLEEMGIDINNWTMCYPYGGYNSDTLEVLTEKKCKLAFTTEVDVYNLDLHNKYEVPRLDTNDIPKDRKSKVNKWYLLA